MTDEVATVLENIQRRTESGGGEPLIVSNSFLAEIGRQYLLSTSINTLSSKPVDNDPPDDASGGEKEQP